MWESASEGGVDVSTKAEHPYLSLAGERNSVVQLSVIMRQIIAVLFAKPI